MPKTKYYEVVIAVDIPSYKRVRVKATSKRDAERQVSMSLESFADDETQDGWNDHRELSGNLRIVQNATIVQPQETFN